MPSFVRGWCRGQKVSIEKDEVEEQLQVDGRQLRYIQVEAGFSQPNAGMCEVGGGSLRAVGGLLAGGRWMRQVGGGSLRVVGGLLAGGRWRRPSTPAWAMYAPVEPSPPGMQGMRQRVMLTCWAWVDGIVGGRLHKSRHCSGGQHTALPNTLR